MKGPRWVVGMALVMLFWSISAAAAQGLRLAAWLLDYEHDYKQIRDDVDKLHERQQREGTCPTCGF